MEGAEIYHELRNLALSVDPAEIGLAAAPDGDDVWGVVMDLGYPEGTATVVALGDGTTSLYTSSGGGVIGAGEDARVADATRRWLRVAEEAVQALEPATEFPLPPSGYVAFNVLTHSGGFRAAAPQASLVRDDTPLAALYAAGQDVITEVRRVDEARS